MNKNIFIKLIFPVLIILIFAGCYQLNEPVNGDLSLNVTAPAKAASDGTGWVVCLVVDAAFEDQFIEMQNLYDSSEYQGDQGNTALEEQFEDDADEILEDMLTKGALRFDGGRFFYQFKTDTSGADTGDFMIPGIPADKDYFLYVLVFDAEITSIDDMEDAEADVYMEMHYYDPDYYTGGHPGIPGTVGAGWYYFEEWDYTESLGNPALSASTVIWQKSGANVSNQPFTVEAGEETALDILLIEDPS